MSSRKFSTECELNPMSKVLLIDDDSELLDILRQYLEQEGFQVGLAHNGETGVTEAVSGRYAIAVLDLMMPRMNGIETLRRIRNTSNLPVLMLTARGDDTDKIIGLELGADDYVPKPCTPRELTARLRAILKRVGGGAQSAAAPIVLGTLTVWPAKRRAERAGMPLDLTSTEFNLLEVLARHAGLPVSKADL